MVRTSVSSSDIRSVGYESGSHILEVEFVSNGSVYQYSGVPQYIYDSLMSASSHGSYFAANIKNKYPTKRIR